MMACNPPYARGITGQWDKCRFPGVLRQDCYDYINFNYDCSGKPYCPNRVIVIEMCNDNAVTDDNGDISLNGTKIGSVDFHWMSRTGYFFIAHPSATLKVADSNIKGCHQGDQVGTEPITSRFSDDLVKGGSNTITFTRTKDNERGNAGVFLIRSYLLRDGELVCPCSIRDIPYGVPGDYTFTYDNCCGSTNEAPSCPCSSISGSFGSGLGNCERIDNVSKVTNNFKTKALLEAAGDANDEIIINGQIYQAGVFPFNWSSFSGGCSVDGDNGAHAWSYSKILQPNESVTFGGKDNGFGGGVNGSWTLEVESCSDSGSGSSSDKCNITVQLRTTGCCLELEESTGRMYAVGAGIVRANVTSGLNSKCCPSFKLKVNGKRWSNTVRDGEPIIVEVDSECKCAKKKPWRTPGGFKPGPCNKGPAPTPGPLRILKNIETGVYQIELNLNTNSSQNDCGCG
jgi:hypothetical protein